MAEAKEKQSVAPVEEERTWGEAAKDVYGNVVSTLANGGRGLQVLGSALDAAGNTDNFRFQKAKMAHDYAMMQNREESAKVNLANARNADRRAEESATRTAESHAQRMKFEAENHALNKQSKEQQIAKNDLALESSRLQLEEWKKGEAAREADRKIQQRDLDLKYKLGEMKRVHENIRNQIAGDPESGWQEFTLAEQNEIMNDPDVRNYAEFHYTVRELLKSRKDPEAWARCQRMVEDSGGSISDDGNGNYSVHLNGYEVALNEDTVQKLGGILQDRMKAEIAERRSMSFNNTRGSVPGKLHADGVKKLLPLFGGNAVEASKAWHATFSTLTDYQKGIMVLHRTLKDMYDPAVGNEEKMSQAEMVIANDASGMSLLSRLGFTYNPGKEQMNDATVIDQRSKKVYSLPEFFAYLEKEDSGSRLFEESYNQMKASFDLQQKLAIAKTLGKGGEGKGEKDDFWGDEGEKGTQTVDTKKIYSDLASKYTQSFLLLDDKKQDSLIRLAGSLQRTLDKYLATNKTDDPQNLSIAELDSLEKHWNEGLKSYDLSPTIFFSPVKKYILNKQNLSALDKEVALQKRIDAIEIKNKFRPGFNPGDHDKYLHKLSSRYYAKGPDGSPKLINEEAQKLAHPEHRLPTEEELKEDLDVFYYRTANVKDLKEYNDLLTQRDSLQKKRKEISKELKSIGEKLNAHPKRGRKPIDYKTLEKLLSQKRK